MKKQAREALDAYYVEADSWAQDRQDALARLAPDRLDRRRRRGPVAVLLAIALVVLMPLKTVEPYTLLVDRQTGFVQALKPLDPERISGDAALTQSFLVQYVIARESFDIDTLQDELPQGRLVVGRAGARAIMSPAIAGLQSAKPARRSIRARA